MNNSRQGDGQNGSKLVQGKSVATSGPTHSLDAEPVSEVDVLATKSSGTGEKVNVVGEHIRSWKLVCASDVTSRGRVSTFLSRDSFSNTKFLDDSRATRVVTSLYLGLLTNTSVS